MQALSPIGMQGLTENAQGIGMSADGKCSPCLLPATEKPAHLHLAYVAAARAQVDIFHRVARAAGTRDHGAPGLRPSYSDLITAAAVPRHS